MSWHFFFLNMWMFWTCFLLFRSLLPFTVVIICIKLYFWYVIHFFESLFCLFPLKIPAWTLFCALFLFCNHFYLFNKKINLKSLHALSFFSFFLDCVQVVFEFALFFTMFSWGIAKIAGNDFHFDYILIIPVRVYPGDRWSNSVWACLLFTSQVRTCLSVTVQLVLRC